MICKSAAKVLALGLVATLCLVSDRGSLAQEIATPEPAVSAPSTLPASAATDVLTGAPHLQVIAQGVMTIEGPVVWRVRDVPVSASGAPESPASSFALQRTGAAVIRNELTGRRTRLEPGEGAFLSAGDPVLRSAVGPEPSLLWAIELLAPDASATDAASTGAPLFTSDAIADYPRSTFEVELSRGVLLPDEAAVLPPSTGPALVMVASGQVGLTLDDGQVASLQAGEGRMVTAQASLRNAESQPAVFVVAAFGEPLDGAEAASGTGLPTPAPSSLPGTPTDLPPIATVAPQPTALPAAPAPEPVIVPTPVPAAIEEPASAAVDSDGDAIADVDETATYGTDPFAWDTDGDGLGDGEEVFGYGTNPLLWDTDGDGVSDGEEVYTYGTNALDPASGP